MLDSMAIVAYNLLAVGTHKGARLCANTDQTGIQMTDPPVVNSPALRASLGRSGGLRLAAPAGLI